MTGTSGILDHKHHQARGVFDVSFTPIDDGWPLKTAIQMQIAKSGRDGAQSSCTGSTSILRDSIVYFKSEPRDVSYGTLLNYASRNCFAFMLVQHYCLSPSRILDDLMPWLCLERHATSWPGTTLLDGTAWVRWYKVTQESISHLESKDGLYWWRRPNNPEDLAFYLEDGRGWLGSIAHEGEGWLDLATTNPDEKEGLLQTLRRYGTIE